MELPILIETYDAFCSGLGEERDSHKQKARGRNELEKTSSFFHSIRSGNFNNQTRCPVGSIRK
jgi:hypothetical protein